MLSTAFMTGVDERVVSQRKKTEAAHLKSVKKPIDDVLEELKEAGDWKVISLSELRKKYKIRSTAACIRMAYALKADPNLISKPLKLTEKNKEAGEIPTTIPLEYKYVTREEKQKLGFDAQTFRHIAFGRKDMVVNAFNKAVEEGRLKKEDVHPVDVMYVLEYCYNKGATEGWIYLEPIRMATQTGVALERLALAVKQVQEAHLMVTAPASRETQVGPKAAAAGIITPTETEYEKRVKEAETPEKIKVHKAKTEKRNFRKQAAEKRQAMIEKKLPALKAIEDKKGNISAKDIHDVVNAPAEEVVLPQESEEQNASPETDMSQKVQKASSAQEQSTEIVPEETSNDASIHEMDLQFEQVYSKILEQGKKQLKNSVEKYVQDIAAKYQKQLNALTKEIEQEKKKYLRYETKISKLEEKNAKLTQQMDSLVDFNNAFVTNAQVKMNAFVGGALDILYPATTAYKFQLNDPDFVNQIRNKLLELIGDTSKSITDFKMDKYPPALKR